VNAGLTVCVIVTSVAVLRPPLATTTLKVALLPAATVGGPACDTLTSFGGRSTPVGLREPPHETSNEPARTAAKRA
jgi:uncharacterized membrane protein YdcZ (DUF606 family)